MGLRVEVIGDEQIVARLQNSSARQAVMASHLDVETALVHGAVVVGTPVGVTSLLRGSWQTETIVSSTMFRGIVGSPLIYSEVIERGRSAGAAMPPPDAIAAWVAAKLGSDVDPFVVARSIGEKGFEGRRMLEKAMALTLPVRQSLRDALPARLMEVS